MRFDLPQSSDLSPAPSAPQDVDIPDEAYGAKTAFSLLGPGEQLDPAYRQEADRANRTRAAELQNQFLDRQRRILHIGPDAFLNKTGRDAVLGADDVLAKLDAVRRETLAQAANGMQRKLRYRPDSPETEGKVDAARSAIWHHAIAAALEHWNLGAAIDLHDRANDRLTEADASRLAPQIAAAKEYRTAQDYVANLPPPPTTNIDTAHLLALAKNDGDWLHDRSQHTTNQHLIDMAFGQKKRALLQAKADLDQAVSDWLDRPRQTQRPPLAIWSRLSPEQKRIVDQRIVQSTDALTNDLRVMSDVDPEPFRDGQRIAQVRKGGSSTRRATGENLTPMEVLRLSNFSRHLEEIREIEPNNRE